MGILYTCNLEFTIHLFPSYGFRNILVVGPLLVLLSPLAPGTRVLGEVECEHLTNEAVCVGAWRVKWCVLDRICFKNTYSLDKLLRNKLFWTLFFNLSQPSFLLRPFTCLCVVIKSAGFAGGGERDRPTFVVTHQQQLSSQLSEAERSKRRI